MQVWVFLESAIFHLSVKETNSTVSLHKILNHELKSTIIMYAVQVYTTVM